MSILFFVLGLIFGSFGSVLITRVPCGESICGRSGCPECKKTLTPLELIPLLSYFILRGRCTGCKIQIGWIYPTIELASGLLFIMAWTLVGSFVAALLLALCLWLLLLIAFIDYKTHTISDLLNLPLLVLAIAYSLLIGQLQTTGIIIGAGFFGVQWVLSRGKWVGSGDIILGAGIGALMGSGERMVACLLLIYIIGGIIAGALLITHKVQRGQYVPFAPFIVLGTIAAIALQTRIDLLIDLYIQF
jgi:prepilin signal peptidase PulO-like enzyme (type II secretory pathway)